MGATISTGPTINAGPLLGRLDAPDVNPEMGPDASYQGGTVLDPRFQIGGGDTRPGTIRAHQDTSFFQLYSGIPAPTSATNVAAAANVVTGTAMVLAGASSGIVPNVPFYPLTNITFPGNVTVPAQAQVLATSALTIDMGFSKLNCTSGSKTVTPTALAMASGLFFAGQYIMIGNVGNAGGTIPLVTFITAVGTTTLTLNDAALATNAAAPVANVNNLFTLNLPLPAPGALGFYPYMVGGDLAIWNPLEGCARGLQITGVTGSPGGTFIVRGWDAYAMPVAETVTVAAGASVGYTKRAFKHIQSITPQFTAAFNYSVGLSDIMGAAMRADNFDEMNLYINNVFNSVTTAFVGGDLTTPATATTGDVRGTFQTGTAGPNTGAATTLNGTSVRISMYISVPGWRLVGATPANASPQYGNLQYYA